MVTPARGDIYWVNLEPALGPEIKKTRPCLVVSRDEANQNYGQVSILPLTSQCLDQVEPFQVILTAKEIGLDRDSKILAEQIRTVSKLRLGNRMGRLNQELMVKVNKAVKLHLDLA